jgi:hypothetical protein
VKKGAAEIVRQQVQKVKDTAQTLVDEINRDKLQANTELENAKPALLVSLIWRNKIKKKIEFDCFRQRKKLY